MVIQNEGLDPCIAGLNKTQDPNLVFFPVLLFVTCVGEVGVGWGHLISNSANLRPQHVLSNMSSIWQVLVGDAKLDILG